jgi:hypothetical protein
MSFMPTQKGTLDLVVMKLIDAHLDLYGRFETKVFVDDCAFIFVSGAKSAF